jgi:hypothetical protein
LKAGRTPAQVTKSPETKAFFAEASQNPSVYLQSSSSDNDPGFSAANAPFVDAAEAEEPVCDQSGCCSPKYPESFAIQILFENLINVLQGLEL